MTKSLVRRGVTLCLLLGNFLDIDNLVKADQPVHCLKQDFVGEWTFHVSKDS